jgi:hypothetical protein
MPRIAAWSSDRLSLSFTGNYGPLAEISGNAPTLIYFVEPKRSSETFSQEVANDQKENPKPLFTARDSVQ